MEYKPRKSRQPREIRSRKRVAVSTVCRFETRFRYRRGPESPLVNVPRRTRLFPTATMPPHHLLGLRRWTGLSYKPVPASVRSESSHRWSVFTSELGASLPIPADRGHCDKWWSTRGVGTTVHTVLERLDGCALKRQWRTFVHPARC